MKSKASFGGHPIHPMLIPFPIAFLIGALTFDILYLVANNENFGSLGKYLAIAGIASALIAAIPGIIDYFFTVPPESSAKKRATKHGLVNVTSVILFTIAQFIRVDKEIGLGVILLESGGVILLFVGGWLGGSLVYKNHIGLTSRYAEGGKWNEEHLSAGQNEFIEVGSTDELKTNQMKLVHLNNERIVIGRTENGYVAFSDHCTHKGGSLAGGVMICGTVQCLWHGSQFDVNSGEVKAGPAKKQIKTYSIKEKEGKVYLSLTGKR